MSERDQVVEILRSAISPPFKATMGDGAGNVVVDGRPGYVWCRKLGRSEMLMQAYNRGAQSIEGIIVLIRESRVEHLGYEVIGYAGGGAPDDVYPSVPPHAWTHEWRPGIGRDRVTVYPRAWGYLRAEPIATGSMHVWVTPGWLYYGDEYHWYPGGYSPAFGAPTVATWYQTLYMDPSDQSLHIEDGVEGGYGYAIPPAPPECMLPIAAIESTGTFSAVTENMIEDIRLFMDPIEDCGAIYTGTEIHDHGDDSSGGQLDWDIIWSDAVHDHSNDAEGGLLDWLTHIHAYKEDKSAECDGAKVIFITAQQFEPYSLRVLLNGQEQVDGAANDYLEGAMYDSFTMAVAPIGGDTLIMHYLAQGV